MERSVPWAELKTFMFPTDEDARKQALEDLGLWQRELGIMAKLQDDDRGKGDIYWMANACRLNAQAEIEKIRKEMESWQ